MLFLSSEWIGKFLASPQPCADDTRQRQLRKGCQQASGGSHSCFKFYYALLGFACWFLVHKTTKRLALRLHYTEKTACSEQNQLWVASSASSAPRTWRLPAAWALLHSHLIRVLLVCRKLL
ncbi:hypothetical protein BDV36DRAFT_247466 [Aspergillus pseudocaelatus]|uniref:Uncharacterized protein n=1 Tax=Aspergillus pseudocaelatus TaxID=1825620 RepID=A0ABQ6WXG5_9EURO|nr:hypothetical protein BDV36DRAFT_247466 [Aspergillus pseudocaelatus]